MDTKSLAVTKAKLVKDKRQTFKVESGENEHKDFNTLLCFITASFT